jgi:F0F1-type ATP synthase assembly protein I
VGGRPDRFFASVLSFGWVLPASIAAGAGLGWVLDRLFHTFPVLTALLGGAGFAAGVRQLAREAARLGEPDEPPPPGGTP